VDTQIDVVRRLLVVDDEPVQCLIVTRAMAALGFAAESAASLEDAIGRAASIRFAGELGLRVAGALPKPVGPSALRALLDKPPPPRVRDRESHPALPSIDELRNALDRQLIVAAYQPKVSLSDGRVVGVEALARWCHPPRGPVPPDVFIPLAEQSGLIIPLTSRVLGDALAACQRWRRNHPACGVAVNISPLVLANPDLPDEIEAMLLQHGLSPDALIAEITESIFIANPMLAIELLTRLRIKGIGLSMDDFGTGYSSLLTLLRLPFTELKIDRSFVASCETDEEAWKIIRATISLARELGLSVVAEGVETDSVAIRLRAAGCQIGQGWRFGRPMPERALHAWLTQRAAAMAP
jgi:EAL domain-containing protein (putative c-di-GMP-specific phosphodiesterase class I)